MGLFPHQKAQTGTELIPRPILKRKKDPRAFLTSCQMTSTQTGSSKTELIQELLEIIHQISAAEWKTRDDLDLSMTECTTSSQSSTSSSEFETITPPPTPPSRGGDT
nr:ORF3 [Torque teno felis virus]